MVETTAAHAHHHDHRVADALTAVGPGLLYGLRLAGAVALALYAAFYLQLDNPSWAGTSAAIVCQPVLGASLRKGFFRLVGTTVGAIATVLLTACFPQDRLGFLVGLAAWCGFCSLLSTLLTNFASYAAMLAGYTMAIIASTSIAAPDQVFTLAVARASEIGVGIVCATLVMSLTDVRRSPARLADTIAGLMAEIAAGTVEQLHRAGTSAHDMAEVRRALIQRVAALDPLIDQTLGEAPGIADRRTTFRAGINGLFLALSAWRTIAAHLGRLPAETATALAARLLAALPPSVITPTSNQLKRAARADRDEWFASADQIGEAPVQSASERLGTDRIASILLGLGRAANVVVLLADSRQALPLRAVPASLVADILPSLVNAARVFVAIVAGASLYLVTAWPSGPTFITFLAVTVLLLSPRDEQAYATMIGFAAGTVLTTVIAALVKFAVLPNHEGFGSLGLILAAVLVPLGALSTRPKLSIALIPATANFVPLLSPTNATVFDIAAFANSALAIVAGCLAGAIVLRVMPPVPPARRAARLVGLTLADLRRIARDPFCLTPDRWRGRVFKRLLTLPAAATPLQGSSLLSALTVGLQLMELATSGAEAGVDTTPVRVIGEALASRDTGQAIDGLHHYDASLGDVMKTRPDDAALLRMRVAAREIAETLGDYADFFGAEIR